MLRPLTVKGLGFFRSKSAPPSPRDKSRAPSVVSRFRKDTLTTVLDREPETQGFSTAGQEEKCVTSKATRPDDKGDRTILLPTSDFAAPETPPLRKKVRSGILSPVPNTVSTRSTLPAPAFEAFLLDRKRRLNATGKDAAFMSSPSKGEGRPSVVRAGTPSGKSNKFKSSPLGGGEPTGIVIAEKIKQDMKD